MALIKCNECGKEISSQAESCPNCGYKVKSNNKKIKKTGTIVTLVASSIFVILFILMLLSELTPTQKNPEYSNNAGITIGAPQNKEIISRDILLWLNWTFVLSPVAIMILSIIHLAKHKPSKKIYGIITLLLSILWLFTVIIYISKANFGCCYIIFVINPIISTIGSILTLIELVGEQKNELKTDNK